MLGKREARFGVDDILALVDKLQITTLIPQIQQFLNSDKLQQLQNQFFSTALAAANNHWNLATVAQAIQQLVTQFVPQVADMRIE